MHPDFRGSAWKLRQVVKRAGVQEGTSQTSGQSSWGALGDTDDARQ